MTGARVHSFNATVVALALCLSAPLGAAAAPAASREHFNPRGPALDPAIPSLADLEARGARIGRITIVVEDIFDREDPRENNRLFLLADRLHVNSKASAIHAQLLFQEGEKLRASPLEETERILRTSVPI
jgi:hypothetical protein